MGTKKRGNGQGSVYKRPNGTWRAEWTLGYKPDGTRTSKRKSGFRTKKEALAFLEAQQRQPTYEAIKLQEVYELVKGELETLSKDKQCAYDIAYRRLRPLWFRPMADIKLPELQKLIDQTPGPFYPKRDVKALLGKIFRYALANDWVTKDYTKYILLPKCPAPEKKAYTDEDIAIMWQHYAKARQGSEERFIFGCALILIYSGMRTGELLAATKNDVRLNERYLTCGIKTEAGKQRHIPIATKIVPVLAELMAAPGSRLVSMGHNQFYKLYKTVLSKAGVSDLPPGSGRHTFNTRLAKAGVQPAVIQRAAGHRSYQTTLGYTHLAIDDVLEAVDKL